MHNNKYLILFCCLIIAFTGFIRSINVDKDTLKAQVIEIYSDSLEYNNSKNTHVLVDDILIKDNGPTRAPIKTKNDSSTSVSVLTPDPTISKSDISAESYLVGNLQTGEVYISHNSNSVFPIASLSKLYTALVAHHLFNLQEKITITQTMLDTYGDTGHLILGEKFLPNELLSPLLLESSNDAAAAYSEYFGGEKFIEQMNGFASEIGMKKTHFKDSSGLSASNTSNVSDLFTLAQFLYKNEREILDISKKRLVEMEKTEEHEAHKFVNINPYSNYQDFIGGKTGRTEWAKESMISLFSHNIANVNFPVVVIVLRSEFGQREIDTEKLLSKFIEKVSGN